MYFMAFSDCEFLPQRFKNICCWKIDCGKHYRLSKFFIELPRTPSGTAKAVATFKETTNCKIPHAVGAMWSPGTDFSLSHAFLTIHLKKETGIKFRMHI